MKKTLFLIFAIFFISVETFSQTNIRTDKYRTIQSGIFTDDGVIEWGDTDFLITITTNNFVITKINIYAKKENQYDIIGLKDTYKDSNDIAWGVFDCLDSDNERYVLEHGIFNNINGHIFTIKFTNKDGNGLIYKLKRN